MNPVLTHINICIAKIDDRITRLRIYSKMTSSASIRKSQVLPILLAFLLIFMPLRSWSTDIVILRTQNYAIVAADSKRTVGEEGQFVTACKINWSHGVLYLATSATVMPTFYNSFAVAEDAIHGGGTVQEIGKRFESLIKPKLSKAISEAIAKPGVNQRMYKKLTQREPVLGMAFVGMNNGIATVSDRTFRVVVLDKTGRFRINVDANDCPAHCTPGDIQMVNMGGFISLQLSQEIIRKYGLEGLPQAAREIVQWEIDHNPITIGPPINVVKLDDTGVYWIEAHPPCQKVN